MSVTPAQLPKSIEDVVNVDDFFERVLPAYEKGYGDTALEADLDTARSVIPAATGGIRDFSFIAPEIPEFIAENCVGCMDCVTECPDTAILAKAIPFSKMEEMLAQYPEGEHEIMRRNWAKTRKYYDAHQKKREALLAKAAKEEDAAKKAALEAQAEASPEGAAFGIFIDPTKCKGCAECVHVCDDNALKMIRKTDENFPVIRKQWDHYQAAGPTPKEYIMEKVLADMMLSNDALQYVGGAGSCAGCGEATVLRMMVAATCFTHGPKNVGIAASTGCNTVYTSTYPYNPYTLPWSNSLFENGPTFAMGIRARWNQMGWGDKKLWVVGGDGAMLDIGFQALSRMLMSGMDINVIVLDTQVYSNTGGQASTASFTCQDTKLSIHGSAIGGKTERRKELAQIMHPNVFVAQTTAAHVNHFYKAILRANEYKGPSVVVTYTTCQPEHGVGDHMAGHQAKLAVDSRAFPLIIHDPEAGELLRDRLDLKGNPEPTKDWYTNPKTGERIDFTTFARTEQRFRKHFDKEGNPSAALLAANEDRRQNWRLLQELAGIEPEKHEAERQAG
jgi:pyruvate/2-oxoacid:ferredoxin oxidoreductase beta subunit/NAD-dependent dihydropyrimidine dehydrogenase PreA subunit